MKLIIYGHRGWIGTQFVRMLKSTAPEIRYHLSDERCDRYEDLCREVEKVQATHMVSFIGRTHGWEKGTYFSTIDFLEQDGRLVDNVRDNLFGPVVLALIAARYDLHFTYLGTGCIFEYDETHPMGCEITGFTESASPNFFGSSYSIVKGFTDRFMQIMSGRILQLRIRMPIVGEDHPRNFITKITHYEKICSIPNSMTVLPDLLPVMIDMVCKSKTGTYNFTNPGVISHNEILDLYTELCDPGFRYTNFTTEEQDRLLASRRSNNCLDTTKLMKEYPSVPPIKESIKQILTNYRAHDK